MKVTNINILFIPISGKNDVLSVIQGVRGQSGFFNWALKERNIQVK